MNAALKPYLAGSAVLHAAAVAAFLILAARAGSKSAQVYMIDFVGGAPTIASVAPAAAAPVAPAARVKPSSGAVPEQVDADAVHTRGHRGPVALPRPSLLHGGRTDEAPADDRTSTSLAGRADAVISATPSPTISAAPGGATGGTAGAGTGVTTDLPNFPYAWYIAQMRQMLWTEWQKRMPRVDAEGGVSFSILRNGAVTDLGVESSSGDPDFDRAALAAVQAAAPFPALPSAFPEPFLKIHLTVKAEESWR